MGTSLLVFDTEGDLILILKSREESNGDCSDSSISSGGETRMHVSSKHLTLASPVFHAMLKRGVFKEGIDLAAGGTVEIPLPDDNPAAFEILFWMIHGKFSQVQRKVDLKLLAEIAILVDKYQMHEVALILSDIWFDDLMKDIPATLDDTVLLWITVCWVFKKSEEFTTITKLAQWEVGHTFGRNANDTLLPIPKSVIDAIHTAREDLILKACRVSDKLIQRLLQEENQCLSLGSPLACDAMALGCVVKGASKAGLWPISAPRFKALTFRGVTQVLRNLKIETLCENAGGGLFKKFALVHDYQEWIILSLNSIEGELFGLEILDFE